MGWLTGDPLMLTLWAGSLLSELWLVAAVLRSRDFRFPCFAWMAGFDLAKSVVLVFCTAGGNLEAYYQIYWWGLAIQAGLTLAALVEIASYTLKPYETLPPRFRVNCAAGLTLVALVAFVAFIRGQHSYHDWLCSTGSLADRSTSIFGFGLTGLLLFLTQRSGLPWRPRAHRIIVGMAIMFSFDQVTTTVLVSTGNAHIALLSYVRMLVFATVQCIWISALSIPDPARIRPTSATIAAMHGLTRSITQQVKDCASWKSPS